MLSNMPIEEPSYLSPIFQKIDHICTTGTNQNHPDNPNIVVYGTAPNHSIQVFKWLDENHQTRFALNINSEFVYFDEYGNIYRITNHLGHNITYTEDQILHILNQFQEIPMRKNAFPHEPSSLPDGSVHQLAPSPPRP